WDNTAAASDTQAPTVPANLKATAVSSSQINLTWTASTDNVGVAGYKVYINGVLIQTVTGTNYSDDGLRPSTAYAYTVAAFDAAGNVSAQSAVVSATTLAASDTQAPTVPANLDATTISSSQIDLTWMASTDNVGVAGYYVYRDGVLAATVSATAYSDKGLSSSTVFQYTVAAFDAAGNVSGQSAPIWDNTAAASDTQAPTVPANLKATAVSSSQIDLTWTDSTDNVGVAGYKIYRNGTQITTSASTSYADAGLAASTAYAYTVSAFDAAGNVSAQSLSVSAATLANPYVPAILTTDALELTAPNGGEYLWSGKVFNIQWTAPATAVTFDLEYSIDNGSTWMIIASGVSGANYNWFVPVLSKKMQGCYLKVTAYSISKSRVGEDKSDKKFTIVR
ncbi:MAG: hypothetical protein OEW04_03695, partial [Nitrospirota bacterium]|nr:hypothetical protein [Nitrospirota bacterium]